MKPRESGAFMFLYKFLLLPYFTVLNMRRYHQSMKSW